MVDWSKDANLMTALLHGAAAALLLIACLVTLAANRLNKGAKANVAWGLLAAGFACVGLAEAGSAFSEVFPPLAYFKEWFVALGALLIAAGAIVWRGLIAGMRK